jgi:hypothetical protein
MYSGGEVTSVNKQCVDPGIVTEYEYPQSIDPDLAYEEVASDVDGSGPDGQEPVVTQPAYQEGDPSTKLEFINYFKNSEPSRNSSVRLFETKPEAKVASYVDDVQEHISELETAQRAIEAARSVFQDDE